MRTFHNPLDIQSAEHIGRSILESRCPDINDESFHSSAWTRGSSSGKFTSGGGMEHMRNC